MNSCEKHGKDDFYQCLNERIKLMLTQFKMFQHTEGVVGMSRGLDLKLKALKRFMKC